ncbi:MAG: hypothetical protein J6X10_08420 [Bacteroidales bacterium]|nr:hypothetical protein [Bacteroidales bacterium]
MKSTIITFIVGLFILSTVCANAQDVIVKKDNSTILSKVTKISSTEIEYKKWTNLDGPTYIINKSDVVSINYQNGEIEKFTADISEEEKPQEPVVIQQQVQQQSNQSHNDNNDGGYMERDGNGLTLNGRDLSDDEVLELVGYENYQTYLSAKKQINTGRAFTVITLVSLGASVGLIALGAMDEDEGLMLVGVGVEVIADVALITTIILKGSGKGRMNWVADEYNRQHRGYSLNLSPSVIKCKTPQLQNNYGVGLTLSLNF